MKSYPFLFRLFLLISSIFLACKFFFPGISRERIPMYSKRASLYFPRKRKGSYINYVDRQGGDGASQISTFQRLVHNDEGERDGSPITL